eukprot:2240800-Alexandrium_andersonii.AAC.1
MPISSPRRAALAATVIGCRPAWTRNRNRYRRGGPVWSAVLRLLTCSPYPVSPRRAMPGARTVLALWPGPHFPQGGRNLTVSTVCAHCSR